MTWLIVMTAAWMGILTSISPCPLASNIAAISFIGKDVEDRRRVLLAGLLYTIGRTVTYVVLAMVLLWGMLATVQVSAFFQRYGAVFLGPVLIVVGMILLGWLGAGLGVQAGSESLRLRLARAGWLGPLILGVLFALSFCPVSASLFFGTLLTLAREGDSWLVVPAVYGFGTAVPVVVFAALIAFAAGSVGRAFNCLKRIEFWIRHVLGVGLILAGIYYTLRFTYGLF